MSAERTAPPTVEEVTDVLSTVIDPELGSDVVSLGMIPRTEISPDGAVIVEVRLTISGCPMRAEIKKMVEQRLLVHPGVTKVRLEWSEMDSDERSAAMSTARAAARDRAPETAIGQRCQVLAISSGKGGVGKVPSPSILPPVLQRRGSPSVYLMPTSGASQSLAFWE